VANADKTNSRSLLAGYRDRMIAVPHGRPGSMSAIVNGRASPITFSLNQVLLRSPTRTDIDIGRHPLPTSTAGTTTISGVSHGSRTMIPVTAVR
jgi:hypothetical protein